MDEVEALKAELAGKSGVAQEQIMSELAETKQKLELTVLKSQHRDFDAIRKSNEFQNWRVANQNGLDLDNGDNAAEFLDRYKATDVYATWAGIQPKQTAREIHAANQQRLKAAQVVPGRQPPPTRGEADMSIQELRKRAADAIWAKRKG
jgi:hypothetical protein